MPQYTFRCPKCGAVEERIVKLSERDEQFCVHVTEDVTTPRPADSSIESYSLPCGEKLVRDSVELTARMPHAWKS